MLREMNEARDVLRMDGREMEMWREWCGLFSGEWSDDLMEGEVMLLDGFMGGCGVGCG